MADAKPNNGLEVPDHGEDDRTTGAIPRRPQSFTETQEEGELPDVKRQVSQLDRTIKQALELLHYNQERSSRDIKPLLKPRDIAILELRHLRGVEGEGRLEVFFSQVEQCSALWEDRKTIVLSRVDPQLAVYIQDILLNGPQFTWKEFKSYLRKELTDQNKNKLFDALNELKYSYQDDPIEFMNKIKCKYALLSMKNDALEIPRREKLIKTKLAKGMPKDCRERLELFLDDNVSLERFLDKLEVERVVANTRSREEIFMVTNPPVTPKVSPVTPPVDTTSTSLTSRITQLEKELEQLGRSQQQRPSWNPRQVYCPYCRSNTHEIQNCRRNPVPGSCFDCLRLGCRRGNPNCPGRSARTR